MLPELNHLKPIAEKHFNAAFPNISNDDYKEVIGWEVLLCKRWMRSRLISSVRACRELLDTLHFVSLLEVTIAMKLAYCQAESSSASHQYICDSESSSE